MASKSDGIMGLLNIDKPKGITSHDVVNRVRKLSGQSKVGHAGTLDPLATGVLVVCLGKATRLIEYFMSDEKQYQGTVRFGRTTDTLDADGRITSRTDPSHLTPSQIKAVLPRFRGEIEQVPPVFSALKVKGQPLYKFARAGQQIKVEARQVTIKTLEWLDWNPPDLSLEVHCSAGTYVRSLAHDLGQALGVGGHLAALTRIKSGPWALAEAVPLHQLEAEAEDGSNAWTQHLQPADSAVAHLPAVTLSEEAATDVQYGRRIELTASEAETEEDYMRAYTPDGKFLAILTPIPSSDNLWRPKKVFLPGGSPVAP